MQRRDLLKGVLGCSLAASPLVTPVSFAASPDTGALGDQRLVVIILRGAMDGLDLVQPVGDPAYSALRPGLSKGTPLGLDGFYALHPAAAPILPLWNAGELAFAQAVSSPYRGNRSHFDAQDLLEAGGDVLGGRRRDGWLNRMLQHVKGVERETAYSIGIDRMNLMSGAAEVSDWSPDVQINLSPHGERLLSLVMHDDPLFQSATDEALQILNSLKAPVEDALDENMMGMGGDMAMMEPAKTGTEARIAEFAANRLRGTSRIAAFSLGGWDTHANQARNFKRTVVRLNDALLRLRQGLGNVWAKTTVVAMTEFGRTAFENGSGGTDHGTGGMAILAGGRLNGKRVYGDWPGLGPEDLLQGRDLLPTRDVRAYPGWAMHMLYGLEKNVIETNIFPGLELGPNPGFIS